MYVTVLVMHCYEDVYLVSIMEAIYNALGRALSGVRLYYRTVKWQRSTLTAKRYFPLPIHVRANRVGDHKVLCGWSDLQI